MVVEGGGGGKASGDRQQWYAAAGRSPFCCAQGNSQEARGLSVRRVWPMLCCAVLRCAVL